MSANTASIDAARVLMRRFAKRTGIEGDAPSRRYLWTDAFAVRNALALEDATGDARFGRMAHTLVDRVHEALGRHRPDDPRRGWLSGLPESEARAHPTRAGLRIGKPLPERRTDEPFDDRLEWERDGQYFHYLTRWMEALDQLARATAEERYARWARELYLAAHRGFVRRTPRGELRMAWKMSIDLTRPLVPSMGQHDPLDGLVTGLGLRATAASFPDAAPEPGLEGALADFAALAAVQPLETTDPLGLGGLLLDASRVARLCQRGACADEALFDRLLEASARSLTAYLARNDLRAPAAQRLAFRELGLAIGLAALDPVIALAEARAIRLEGVGGADAGHDRPGGGAGRSLDVLRRARGLRDLVCGFWQEPAHHDVVTWRAHLDINEVMLATALLPQGWIGSKRMGTSEGEEESCSTKKSGKKRGPAPPVAW